jgi:outer membrane lipoprotein-sorting protein
LLGVGLLATCSLALSGPERAVWAGGASGPGAEAGPVTIDSLLARFRGIVGLSAHFREEKRIALLAQPLVSEGTVHYAPPGRIARHTLTPSPSAVVLDGTTLRFGDATSEHSIDTGASPVVRAFVDSFLAILAGDRASLEKSFVVDFHNPAGQKWEIGLTPRDAGLAKIIREIRFTGDGVVLAQMRIREATGDEGVTTFSDVDAAHRYTPAEADRVFRLAP